MAAALVTLAEQKTFLGIAVTTFDTVVQSILDHVEDLLVTQCGRRHRPFSAAQTARAEVRDGTGTDRIVLDYVVAALTSVKIGRDSSAPNETLDITDVDVLAYAVGKRTLVRVDGGSFGGRGEPRVVHVTYNAAADLPDFCKLAVKRATALIYRQLGSEDAASESIAGYSRTMAKFGRDFVDDDPIWKMAVDSASDFYQ